MWQITKRIVLLVRSPFSSHPSPVLWGEPFSHVKYSLIKMRNVYSVEKGENKIRNISFVRLFFSVFMFATWRRLSSIENECLREKKIQFDFQNASLFIRRTTATWREKSVCCFEEHSSQKGKDTSTIWLLATATARFPLSPLHSHDKNGMKGPIRSLSYAFPIHVLLISVFRSDQTWSEHEHTAQHFTERIIDYWMRKKGKRRISFHCGASKRFPSILSGKNHRAQKNLWESILHLRLPPNVLLMRNIFIFPRSLILSAWCMGIYDGRQLCDWAKNETRALGFQSKLARHK